MWPLYKSLIVGGNGKRTVKTPSSEVSLQREWSIFGPKIVCSGCPY